MIYIKNMYFKYKIHFETESNTKYKLHAYKSEKCEMYSLTRVKNSNLTTPVSNTCISITSQPRDSAKDPQLVRDRRIPCSRYSADLRSQLRTSLELQALQATS